MYSLDQICGAVIGTFNDYDALIERLHRCA
jgi:hypothetical protein